MDPVIERQVLHPPVVGAAVVGDDVHYDLEAFLVCLGNIFLVLGIAAETGVDAVVVAAGVAVV